MNRWLSVLMGNLLLLSCFSFAAPRVLAQEDPEVTEREPQASIEVLEREIGVLRERLRDLVREQSRRRESRGLEQQGRPTGIGDERAEHVRQAIEHLIAAGWPDEANRLRQRMLTPPAEGPAEPHGPGVGPHGPWGQAAADQMRHLNSAMERLSDAVQQLEQRTRDSDHVAAAADEAHRKVQHIEEQLRGFTDELRAQLSERFERLEQEQQRLRESFEHQHQQGSDGEETRDPVER